MIDWRSQVVSLKPAAVAVGKVFDVCEIFTRGVDYVMSGYVLNGYVGTADNYVQAGYVTAGYAGVPAAYAVDGYVTGGYV